jgi:DNA-binding Lrp family transcriptional regulator
MPAGAASSSSTLPASSPHAWRCWLRPRSISHCRSSSWSGRHSAEWATAFRAALADIPEIIGAYRTAGDIDYILRARVPDVAAYDRLYQRLISRVDMVDVSASFVMEEIKDTHELPLGYLG